MDCLVEVDRCSVANQRLPRSRAKQCPDAVAEPDGHVEPSRAVPAPDKVVAPLLFDRTVQGARRGSRHRTERIAVEIDEAFRNHKAVAQTAKRSAASRATHASREIMEADDIMRASRSNTKRHAGSWNARW